MEKICFDCGEDIDGCKFCPECGLRVQRKQEECECEALREVKAQLARANYLVRSVYYHFGLWSEGDKKAETLLEISKEER